MKNKYLALASAFTAAFLLNACGDDSSSSSSVIECVEGDCFEESSSSVIEESSSSSEKKSEESSSSVTVESSSSLVVLESSSSIVESSSSSKEIEAESSSSVTYEFLSETPNVADLEVSGDTLFAVFSRYVYDSDTYTTTFADNGLLALYSLSDGTLLDTISLATKNPVAVKVVKGNVYVASLGEYNASWGTDADENRGIEKVDLSKKTSSLYVSGQTLGGGVYSIAVDYKHAKAYAAIYKYYGSVPVVEIDLSNGSVKTIDGIIDASGSLAFDDENSLLYIGDRGYIDYTTYDMGGIMVYSYNGETLTAISDALEDEFRQPYSVALLSGKPYVFVSDYVTGKLYWNYANADDDTDGLQFDQDSKLSVANGNLFVMERSSAGSIILFDVNTNTVVWQVSAEYGNPYDIVKATSSSVWVAMEQLAEIRLISTVNGSTLSSINTKDFCAKTIVEIDTLDE